MTDRDVHDASAIDEKADASSGSTAAPHDDATVSQHTAPTSDGNVHVEPPAQHAADVGGQAAHATPQRTHDFVHHPPHHDSRKDAQHHAGHAPHAHAHAHAHADGSQAKQEPAAPKDATTIPGGGQGQGQDSAAARHGMAGKASRSNDDLLNDRRAKDIRQRKEDRKQVLLAGGFATPRVLSPVRWCVLIVPYVHTRSYGEC